MFQRRAEKILKRANELAAISEDAKGITRTFGTDAFIAGGHKVADWMQQAGLQVRVDNIGNVRGRLKSATPGAKTLVIASHIDTVVNAGRYDGPLGVLMGIDLIENITINEFLLPFNIELIAFSDEEGVRFHTTFLGSKAVAGSFDDALLDIKDANGITLKEAIKAMDGEPEKIADDALPIDEWLGYFEIHIEQGPILWESNIPVAVVISIAGQQRAELVFKGMAGHAGTVPMDMRADALCAAAEFVVELEKFGLGNKQNIVATVGKLHVADSASNVIPGEVTCSVDIRSADEGVLASALQSIKEICAGLCTRRKIEFYWKPIQGTAPVQCNGRLNMLLKKAIVDAGIKVVDLVSGAGHDAVSISAVAPVSMLFIRCYKGISHHPLENVELNDVAKAIEVSDNFIQQLCLRKA